MSSPLLQIEEPARSLSLLSLSLSVFADRFFWVVVDVGLDLGASSMKTKKH
jgi:hypothetical protein